jgi:translocator protein
LLTAKAGNSRRIRDALGLAIIIAICLGVSAIGGAITATSVGTWYQTLQKPPFNPPDWVFAPVWITLYLLMATAAWRVWRQPGTVLRKTSLLVFGVQLGMNLAWSLLFFGLQRIDLALVEIVLLLLVIAVNTRLFWRQDRLSGILFIPYLLWVSYATALNSALWWLN